MIEKKGDILNQLAVISDLAEKINFESKSQTLIFELSKMEFDRVFDYIQNKRGIKMDKPDESFLITIGMVDIVFNTNNA
jgi:hypothetical protein